MFDIGFWELLVIGVVALVVIGPERLPEVARSAGVYVAKFRRFVAGVKSDIDSELNSGELKKILGDQREQIRELKDIVDNTRKDMETTASGAMKSAGELSSSMESKFKSLDKNGSIDTDVATDVATDLADKPEPAQTGNVEKAGKVAGSAAAGTSAASGNSADTPDNSSESTSVKLSAQVADELSSTSETAPDNSAAGKPASTG